MIEKIVVPVKMNECVGFEKPDGDSYKILETHYSFYMFNDSQFIYAYKYLAEQDDEVAGKVQRNYCGIRIYTKISIQSVVIYWQEKIESWRINASCNGVSTSDEIDFEFKDKKMAMQLFHQLNCWKFGESYVVKIK